MRAVGGGLLLAGLVLLSVSARAQDTASGDGADERHSDSAAPDSASVAEAQALFRRGLELGREDRWADALEHFRRSYDRVSRPSTLFNIGVALGRLGRFVEAIQVFDEVFAGAEALPAEARVEAERLRAEAVASVGEITLSIDPIDATLFVDGVARVGEGPTRIVALDPGRHALRATAPDHDEGTLDLSVLAGEHTRGSLTLTPRILDAVIPPVVPVIPPERSLLEEPVFWIVSSAIVVALGVGIGVGVGVGTAGAPPQYTGTSGIVLLAP